MFLTQLRAILRASRHGKIRLLIPMLAHAHEVEQTLAAVRQAKETLDDNKIPYDQRHTDQARMIECRAAGAVLEIFPSPAARRRASARPRARGEHRNEQRILPVAEARRIARSWVRNICGSRDRSVSRAGRALDWGRPGRRR